MVEATVAARRMGGVVSIDGASGFFGLLLLAIIIYVSYQAGKNQWLG